MNDHGNPPWLANPRWQNGRIHSDAGLDKTISMQSGQGADAVVYYSLKAKTGGKDLKLGDGIKGQPLADGLLELIRDEVGGHQT